jgi:hypothetical protein
MQDTNTYQCNEDNSVRRMLYVSVSHYPAVSFALVSSLRLLHFVLCTHTHTHSSSFAPHQASAPADGEDAAAAPAVVAYHGGLPEGEGMFLYPDGSHYFGMILASALTIPIKCFVLANCLIRVCLQFTFISCFVSTLLGPVFHLFVSDPVTLRFPHPAYIFCVRFLHHSLIRTYSTLYSLTLLLRSLLSLALTGSFVAGQRHGHGTYTYANGDVYCGEFVRDKKHGAGTYSARAHPSQVRIRHGQMMMMMRGSVTGTPHHGPSHNEFWSIIRCITAPSVKQSKQSSTFLSTIRDALVYCYKMPHPTIFHDASFPLCLASGALFVQFTGTWANGQLQAGSSWELLDGSSYTGGMLARMRWVLLMWVCLCVSE